MSLKIWCNLSFRDEQAGERTRLLEGLAGHAAHLFGPEVTGDSGEARELLLNSDVAFGSPEPDVLIESSNLKWAQLFSAGYTEYDRDELRANFIAAGKVLTNSSSVFVEPCAEHLLAMMLANARRLFDTFADQRGERSWPMHAIRAKSRLLTGQRVLIYGFGTIGRRVAELLAPFDMEIVGVRRTPSPDDPVDTIGIGRSDEVLAGADHIVNIFPASGSTARFFDENRFALMSPGAVYYSIGRGSTTDTDALIDALRSGTIAAAYLDVTDPEPLPAGHPLWTTPNCYLTPHTAGGAVDEKSRQVDHFLANLSRFTSGRDLRDRVV